jgi:large subunit ribosomal protein L13
MAKQITRETHTFDATGKTPGRLASKIAPKLIGKHKVDYQPNLDMGDIVEVENVDKMIVTGKKKEQKKYYRHSGYAGGVHSESLKDLMKNNPGEVLRRAVSRMLPKNKLRDKRIKRLKVKN